MQVVTKHQVLCWRITLAEVKQLTRIVAWNINARAKNLDLRRYNIEPLIWLLKPDILILTEYLTNREEHLRFTSRLEAEGFEYRVTDAVPGENRTLIAANMEINDGAAVARTTTLMSANENYLHITLPKFGVDLVGLRVPWFEACQAEHKAAYPDWIVQQLRPLSDKRAIVIGDFNFDPSYRSREKWIQNAFRNELGASSNPAEGQSRWFFYSPNDTNASFYTGSRLDHALFSRTIFRPTSIHYAQTIQGRQIMTSLRPSDHAALVIEIELG